MPDNTQVLILRCLEAMLKAHNDPNDAGNNHEMRMLVDEVRTAIEDAVAKPAPAASETRSQRK